MKLVKIIGLSICLLTDVFAANPTLSLNDFIAEVRLKNSGYLASVESSAGMTERADESSSLFRPNLFSTFQWGYDSKPSVSPATQGDRMATYFSTIGVAQNTPFGLSAKVSYSLTDVNLMGAASSVVRQPQTVEAKPSLEISQPLLRNGLGREWRSMEAMGKAQIAAQTYGEDFRRKAMLVEAESGYWRLSLAREAAEVARQGVLRAQKIYDWSARRNNLQLSDKSDLLQAQAIVEARNLELQMALDEEQAASRAFNGIRGKEGSTVIEQVAPITAELLATQPTPKKSGLREDLLAAQEQEKIARLSAALGMEKGLPNLEVFWNASWIGKDRETTPAMKESLNAQYYTGAVGVRLTAPLDYFLARDVRNGYGREAVAAEMNYSKKVFDQAREWDDLVAKLEEARRRLELVQRIEGIQRQKLEHERDRLGRGRTTTFQLLLFEQDYAGAQLNRIRLQTEVLSIVARLKLFGTSSEGEPQS